MATKEVKFTLVDTAGVLSATVEEVSFGSGVLGGITDLFNSSVAHAGTGAMVGKLLTVGAAIYGTAYLKDGEFNLNPFA